MAKYPKRPNLVPEVGIVALACCDCGLVHKMGFTVDKDGALTLAYTRDNRATAQLRRGKFPFLKSPHKNEKWKIIRNG